MNRSDHFNNSFSDNNIISIDSNGTSSLNDNTKYIKVYESNLTCIKNEVFDIDVHNNNDDNLSQFSGFTFNKDFKDNDNNDDRFEQNLDLDVLSDLDSELDFIFEYDNIIYRHENIEDGNYCSYDYFNEIKIKITNKNKLNKKDLLHIQHATQERKFEIIKLFNSLIE